ncbi:MFS transporter [Nocardioides sp. NPDC059952]|uniref:MFS transporter n=1 Tax=Nocardioides sp. NPDC059952 TaxID=3347014 RepID=UPI003660F908
MSTAVAPVKASRYTATVVAGCFAVLLAQVAYSLPGALNGTFQTEFSASGTDLTWISAAFAIPMVVFELTTGVIGDLFGRKRLLQVGALLTAAGGVVTYAAGSVEVLWAGQIVAGLGAAVLYPISLAMIAALAPSAEQRAKSIALWAGFLSIGAAIAPMLGGALASAGNWRAAYLIVVAAAAVSILVTFAATDSSAPEGRKLDIPGQVTLAVGLIALLFAATHGSEVGFGQPMIIGAAGLGVILLAAFVRIELHTEVPLVQLGLFSNRAYAVVAMATVIGMFAFLGICFSMSIWLGAIQHQEAVRIGILFLFIQGPAFVLVPVVSRLISNVSPRWVLSIGFASMAVAGIWCSTFDVNDISWTRFIAPMLALGIGFAMTVGSITAVAINTVPLRLAGMASATTNLLRDLGFALGPVLVGAVATASANARLVADLEGVVGKLVGSGTLDETRAGAAVGIGHEGGAMALNSMPVIPGGEPVPMPTEIANLAMESLGAAYNLAFLVCGVCAAAAAVLTLVGLVGAQAPAELDPAEAPATA